MKEKQKQYWRNKSVLITGASSGIGRALVEALAPLQVKFCLLSRREENMRELAENLRETGSTFWIRACDVRDRQAVSDAVRAFHGEMGTLDAAWVNSGVSNSSAFKEWDWDAVETMLDTNLKGAIYTIQACLEIMVPQKSGAIVGIGSAASMRGLPTRGVYSLTKIGIEYFLLSKAAELPNLQFTVIHPGFVDTPINRGSSNRFWLVDAAKAADIMLAAVANGRRLMVFPWRMALLYRIVRHLPHPVWHQLAKRVVQLSQPSKPV